MNKILNYISDLFIFWNLKKISSGYLNIVDAKGNEHFFGDSKSHLRAKIKINEPSFCYKILRKGSAGLGDSYVKGEFETEDLTSLIELSAKNINIAKNKQFGNQCVLNQLTNQAPNVIATTVPIIV